MKTFHLDFPAFWSISFGSLGSGRKVSPDIIPSTIKAASIWEMERQVMTFSRAPVAAAIMKIPTPDPDEATPTARARRRSKYNPHNHHTADIHEGETSSYEIKFKK